MPERPLLLPLLSIITGITSAASFSIYYNSFLAGILLIAALPTLFLKSRLPFLVILSLLFMLWGNLSIELLLRPRFADNHIARLTGDEPIVIEGIIADRPRAVDGGGRLQLLTERICSRDGFIPVTGRLLIYIGDGMTPWVTGDRVRLRTRLNEPRNQLLPGAFDYERHLALQGIYTIGFAERQDDVILMREGVAYPHAGALDRLAVRAGSYIASVVPPVEAAVMRALLLGDQGGVPPELADEYTRSGVSHILSISGFHMGIIALVVFQVFYRTVSQLPFLLLHFNMRRLILLATLPVLIFYLFLCGSAPATLRSVIMLGAFIIALTLERETDALDSLLLAAMLILLSRPASLFDVSFQLSFFALWGLIVLTPWFMKPFTLIQEGLRRKGLLFLAASAAATIATAVPVAYHFHQVSFTGLLANFLIVPLLGYGAVVLGFVALPFIMLFPPLADSLLVSAAFLVWLSNAVIEVFARIPVATFLQPRWPSLPLFFIFAVLFTFARGRTRAVGSGATLILLGVSLVPSPMQNHNLQIRFFSIGQGDAALINFPDGSTMLIDGGGNLTWGNRKRSGSVGERLLAPALRYLGVRRIDRLVLTHPHPDHLQGLLYIAENFRVGEFWEGDAGGECYNDYIELKRILAEKGVPMRQFHPGDAPVRIGEATITFPGSSLVQNNQGPDDEEINELSLVFRVTYGSFSGLFTGDIGHPREEQLLRNREEIRCTVLKVPHHGSRYSSSPEFLAAASPCEAVISVGYRNSFHLPATETLERLKACGSRLWRTDVHGTVTVTVESDGGWRIDPFPGQKH